MNFGNVFGKLFGTDKAIDHLLDKDSGILVKAGSWIGNLNYTEEDKAENTNKIMAFGLERLKALEPFKVMQRIMVTIIMVEWALLLNTLIVAICMSADKVVANLILLAQSNFAWMPIAGAIGLYLMGGVIPYKNKK